MTEFEFRFALPEVIDQENKHLEADRPKKPRGRPRNTLNILVASDDDATRTPVPPGGNNPVKHVCSPATSDGGDDAVISTANSSDSTETPGQTESETAKTRGRRKLYTTEEQYKESKRINSRNTYQRNAEKMKAARQIYKEAHREELKEKAREKYQKDKLERAEELKAKAKDKYEKKRTRARPRD